MVITCWITYLTCEPGVIFMSHHFVLLKYLPVLMYI